MPWLRATAAAAASRVVVVAAVARETGEAAALPNLEWETVSFQSAFLGPPRKAQRAATANGARRQHHHHRRNKGSSQTKEQKRARVLLCFIPALPSSLSLPLLHRFFSFVVVSPLRS